jgi:hypothetical protein
LYENDVDFETPHDDVGIWRYMDVARFLALLDSKSLYFARVSELGDPWEGAFPLHERREMEARLALHGLSIDDLGSIAPLSGLFVVSCWHQNDRESVAMWKLYTTGAEGIAMRTTIGRLKAVLARNTLSTVIGKVRYLDHDLDDDNHDLDDDNLVHRILNPLTPLFYKRQTFQHEREVRAVTFWVEGFETLKEAMRAIPDLELLKGRAHFSGGRAISIEPSELIERIVVSPQFPPWAMASLRKIVEQSGLRVPLESSDLLKTP